MEGKLYFYMRSDQIPEKYLQDLNNGFNSSSAEEAWYRDNHAKIGLPVNHGFWFWNKERQQFYVTDPNARMTLWWPEGFPMPEHMFGLESCVSEVQAVIFFNTRKVNTEGLYTTEKQRLDGFSPNPQLKAVHHFEILKPGHERYRLIVEGARSLNELNAFVAAIRAGKIGPIEIWS